MIAISFFISADSPCSVEARTPMSVVARLLRGMGKRRELTFISYSEGEATGSAPGSPVFVAITHFNEAEAGKT
jgi:hypothetical protein